MSATRKRSIRLFKFERPLFLVDEGEAVSRRIAGLDLIILASLTLPHEFDPRLKLHLGSLG